MNIRTLIGLLLFFFAHPLFALPTELSGTWVQPDKNESGAMLVHVREYTAHAVHGVIEIKKSTDCTQPIAFRGTIEPNRVLIESTEAIVCGYNGKLTGEMVKEGEHVYSGTFRYTYSLFSWPMTFAEGVFRLVPKER